MKKKLIYLSGFMGSGKTTVGKILGKKLNLDFIDLDVLIEEKEGRAITDIFKELGEKYFRKIEKENLRAVSDSGKKIVSLGGGALMDEENQIFVKDKGILVYLKVTPEEIYERLENTIDRPLLLKEDKILCSKNEFKVRISSLFKAREPGYLTAGYVIDTVGRTPEKIADEIISYISR
ncbi:shikimate kinase [candidate division KSB1 bacterium]